MGVISAPAVALALASLEKSVVDAAAIDLNAAEPEVTDICWMDVAIGKDKPQRVEIALYGEIVPRTVQNFIALCKNELKSSNEKETMSGYRGSSFFRVISKFSVQGGNVGQPANEPLSRIARYGTSSFGTPFPPGTVSGPPPQSLVLVTRSFILLLIRKLSNRP